MSDTSVDAKPVVDTPAEPSEDKSTAVIGEETGDQSAPPSEVSEPALSLGGDKEPEPAEEKMDVEASAVETAATDEPKPAEEPAVDEPEVKGVEPSVEPVPDTAPLKSPVDSSLNMVSSPAPAVPSSTPPRSSQNSKKPKVDLTSVPVRQYLDTTVVPILLQGLSSLARERPAKPIQYLANFLQERAHEYDEWSICRP